MKKIQLTSMAIALVLAIFSYVTPVRLPPNVVSFKEALISFVILLALLNSALVSRRAISWGFSFGEFLCAHLALFVVFFLAIEDGGNFFINLFYLLISVASFCLGAIEEKRRIRLNLCIGLVSGGFFLAIFSLVGWHGLYVGQGDLAIYIPQDHPGVRAQSGLGQSNNFGVFLCCCLFLVRYLMLAIPTRKYYEIIGWSLIVCLVQGLIVSYSRTAVLGLFLTSLILMGGGMIGLGRKYLLSHVGLLALYLVISSIYRIFFDLDGRASSLEGIGAGDPQRLRMWAMAVEAIAEKPVFGWGLGTIPSIALDKSVTYGAFDYSILTHFHNTPLDLLVQFGLVGGGALLAFFVYLLILAWRGSRNIQNGDVLFAAGIPLLVHAMLEYPFSYGFLFWPFCIWLGYLISFSSTSVIKVPRLVAVPIALAFLSFWYVWYSSYMRVESLYTQVRQGYEVTADTVESETYWFEDFAFRHYIDRLKWVLEPVTPQNELSDTQIAELDRVARMYPTDLLLWKNAIARATRGEVSGAAWWAERMCRMYEPSVCDRAASAWQSIEVKDWPVLPWDQWRQK